MKIKLTTIAVLVIIAISFIIGIYLYPQMPEQMASHWNAQGNVDDYMPKFWGIFLMPLVTIAIFLLFLIIPKIDPLKKNIEKFRKYFDGFILVIILFLFYIYILTMLWSLGITFNMTNMIIPAMGIIFYYAGVLTEHAKRNWFIGIRTPWTLSSDVVWDKTHKLGGKMFKIAGIITIIGIFFPKYSIWILLVPVMVAAFYPLIYSYFEYQKLKKK